MMNPFTGGPLPPEDPDSIRRKLEMGPELRFDFVEDDPDERPRGRMLGLNKMLVAAASRSYPDFVPAVRVSTEDKGSDDEPSRQLQVTLDEDLRAALRETLSSELGYEIGVFKTELMDEIQEIRRSTQTAQQVIEECYHQSREAVKRHEAEAGRVRDKLSDLVERFKGETIVADTRWGLRTKDLKGIVGSQDAQLDMLSRLTALVENRGRTVSDLEVGIAVLNRVLIGLALWFGYLVIAAHAGGGS